LKTRYVFSAISLAKDIANPIEFNNQNPGYTENKGTEGFLKPLAVHGEASFKLYQNFRTK